MLFTNNPMDDNNQRCYYRIAFAERRFNGLTGAERYRLVTFMVRKLLPSASLMFTRFQEEPYRVGIYDEFSNTILINISLLLSPINSFYSYDLYSFLYLLYLRQKVSSKKRVQVQLLIEQKPEGKDQKIKESEDQYQVFIVEELNRLLNFYNILQLEDVRLSQYIEEKVQVLYTPNTQKAIVEEVHTFKLGR